ncbi:DUF3995 domain-containing protein [Tenacibaculum halocynthiae]|uniref:DUF3995 domain-containing protein n=1 Tax=Tenacibaculum halocynthiae TaxID=1254437 RepID=UPI003D64A7D0
MTILIFSLILFFTFTLLGSFHIYWLLGGTWGVKKVIPTKNNQLNSVAIPKFATVIVAAVLILFGFVYLVKTELINIELPNIVIEYGYWFIPCIFIIRAIGEFNYVGFFKKIKGTEFAKADSKIFSPLCLGIGILGILIQIIK